MEGVVESIVNLTEGLFCYLKVNDTTNRDCQIRLLITFRKR